MRDRARFGLSLLLLVAAGALISAHSNSCIVTSAADSCLMQPSVYQVSVAEGNAKGNAVAQAEKISPGKPKSVRARVAAFQIKGAFPPYRPGISR